MAETPEFEFTLPEGVMGALHEAARQFQGASAGEGVASVRVAQAFALAAPVLADISAALAQIEDVYLRHELSQQATQLLDLVSSGNVSGIGNIAAQAARLVQQAIQQNSLNQSRLPTKEEKLNALWAEMDQLNKQVGEDLDALGMTEEEKKRRAELIQKIQEAKTQDEKLAAQRELIAFDGAVLDRHQRELDAADLPPEQKAATQKQIDDAKATIDDITDNIELIAALNVPESPAKESVVGKPKDSPTALAQHVDDGTQVAPIGPNSQGSSTQVVI